MTDEVEERKLCRVTFIYYDDVPQRRTVSMEVSVKPDYSPRSLIEGVKSILEQKGYDRLDPFNAHIADIGTEAVGQ
ncbi:hypothetical protein [Streptomyces sp. NPDC057363]|uniref:hypothetical protein n=1 Tax=Streptomyces sp. NPDC057363 TaxID=3346107 RepID=UPI0036256BAB